MLFAFRCFKHVMLCNMTYACTLDIRVLVSRTCILFSRNMMGYKQNFNFNFHKQKTASDSGEVLHYERQDGGFKVGSSSATVSLRDYKTFCLFQCRDKGKVFWHMRTCYSKQERKFNGRLLMRIIVYLRMASSKCRKRDQCPVDTTNLRTVIYNKDEAYFNYWLSLNVSVHLFLMVVRTMYDCTLYNYFITLCLKICLATQKLLLLLLIENFKLWRVIPVV